MSADNFQIFLASGPESNREYRVGMGFLSPDQTWEYIHSCLTNAKVYTNKSDADAAYRKEYGGCYYEYGAAELDTRAPFADLEQCTLGYDNRQPWGTAATSSESMRTLLQSAHQLLTGEWEPNGADRAKFIAKLSVYDV